MRRRLLVLIVLVLAAGCAIHDTVVSPRSSLSTQFVLATIGEYRRHVSPHLQGIVQCRFTPTCSLYGYESVRRHGAVKGGWRTIRRIARCGPWTPMGTIDPP